MGVALVVGVAWCVVGLVALCIVRAGARADLALDEHG